MAMSPEGAVAQGGEDPGISGVAQGLEALGSGTQALLEGLSQGNAPKEAVALAQQAASAISQLKEMMMGGGAPSAQETQAPAV